VQTSLLGSVLSNLLLVLGLLTAGRSIVAAEGPRGLLTGFGPTAVGYLLQGGAKFAGYEASVSPHGSFMNDADGRKNGS